MSYSNNGSDDQKKAIDNTKKTAQQVKKLDDKRKQPVKQAQNLAKNYAKNYGKQQAKKYASKAAKEVAKKAAEAAKKVAEQVGKAIAKAAKAIGKALAEAIKGIGKAIASMGPYGWIALAIILILVCCYGAAVYNSEKISFWFIGESTADGHLFDSTYYDDAITLRDALKADTHNSILGNDLPMLSKSDVIMILDHVIQYNQDMGFEVGIGSKYKEYGVARYAWDMTVSETANLYYGLPSTLYTIDEAIERADDDATKQSLTDLKNNGELFRDGSLNCGYVIDPLPHTSGLWDDTLCLNMSYGQIATLDIEGLEVEKYYNGTYDIDWKLMLILAEMMAESKAAQFGNNSEWTEEDQENLNNSEWFEASMDGYFLTDEDITNLCKLFDYSISCYPDDRGYDYVQIGKLYKEDPYNTSGVVTNISITWGDGIKDTYNGDIEHAYESDVVKRMSFTLYPCTDVYGQNTWISQGIIKNHTWDNGWTYIAPYGIGDVFDGNNAITVDALGNTAVTYVSDESGIYIMNNDEMYDYRAVADMFVPYIAPHSIANVFMKAEYIYDDVENVYGKPAVDYGMEEGTKALSKIVITVDGYNFYTKICQLIPNFSFEHFYELYNYYKVHIDEDGDTPQTKLRKQTYNANIDKEIERWRNIEALYTAAKEAEEMYRQCLSNGISSPYASLAESLKEGEVEVVLPYTAVSGPTGGKIFIGSYSQNRSSSGSSAEITGKSGVWIGESNGKSYYGFLPIQSSARANINRQDAFIEEDDAVAYRKLQIICDELFHKIQIYGSEMNKGDNGAAIDGSSYTNYTGVANDAYSGGPIWVHFCSCHHGSNCEYDSDEDAGKGHNCTHTGSSDGHNYNSGDNIYGNGELILYLLDWQKRNPNYSVSAMLTLLATRTYMTGDPWLIWGNEYNGEDFFGRYASPYRQDAYLVVKRLWYEQGISNDDYSLSDVMGLYWNDIGLVEEFLEYEFGKFMEQVDDGQISFFDMEFGHGFNNTTMSQTAYQEAELKYTYGGRTSNPGSVPFSPSEIGVYPTWWIDPLFPEENIGQVYSMFNDENDAWCNFAGRLREYILGCAGYSCWGVGDWPLALQLGESAVDAYDATGDGITSRTTQISSPYGYRQMSSIKFHYGIDIYCAAGTPVLSVCDGYVMNYGWDSGLVGDTTLGGYMITIQGDDGYVYKYMHLTADSCSKYVTITGRVYAGQQIGESGNTGGSTGPHLHFQMSQGGVTLDPAPFLGVDIYHPWWRTHKVFLTEKECEDAINAGQYNNKFY